MNSSVTITALSVNIVEDLRPSSCDYVVEHTDLAEIEVAKFNSDRLLKFPVSNDKTQLGLQIFE